MFKKLKRKFIMLATISIFLLMSILVGAMNLINYTTVVSDAQNVLHMLNGVGTPLGKNPPHPEKRKPILPRGMSPEVPYESRYFSVTLTQQGSILHTDTDRIVSVDLTDAQEYAQKAMQRRKNSGFINRFRFQKEFVGSEVRIFFLDCGRKLDAFYRFLFISFAMVLLGCLLVFLIFFFAADRILRPIAESYEKQKRFVTDAGHEIKTPLAIIRANVDLMESEFGDCESLTDIREQTERMTTLTNELVYLSKMDESEYALQKVIIPLSEFVEEAVDTFKSSALLRNIQFSSDIQAGLFILGSPDAVRRLLSIVLDNAVKYSPDSEPIHVQCESCGKSLKLRIQNKAAYPVQNEKLPHVFDRFYRLDSSRNSETGGQGIGLSVAQAITAAHNGKIAAFTTDGSDFCLEITLPSH